MVDGESDLSLEKETSIEARLTRRVSFHSGVNLVGNRLFGPQPQTATYLCLWEADLGRVTGHTSPAMLSTLQKVGKTFALNFTDKGNSPPPNIELAVDPDSELLLLTTALFRATKLTTPLLLPLSPSHLLQGLDRSRRLHRLVSCLSDQRHSTLRLRLRNQRSRHGILQKHDERLSPSTRRSDPSPSFNPEPQLVGGLGSLPRPRSRHVPLSDGMARIR